VIDPPKKKRRLGGTALNTESNTTAYREAQRLQAQLRRRLNRTACIAEILPLVFSATLAQLSAHAEEEARYDS
jgi:hypothetical protein